MCIMAEKTAQTTLDMKDRTILHELEIDSRQPISRLAKKVRLSREAVSYRMKKLAESGVILWFRADINITRLGFTYYRLHLRLHNVNKKKEQELVKFFSK